MKPVKAKVLFHAAVLVGEENVSKELHDPQATRISSGPAEVHQDQLQSTVYDVLWCLASLCDLGGINLVKIWGENVDKITRTYPDQSGPLNAGEELIARATAKMKELTGEDIADDTEAIQKLSEPREKMPQPFPHTGAALERLEQLETVVKHPEAAELERLRKFKEYVHERLDKMMVPDFKDGRECRIGSRLDHVFRYGTEHNKPSNVGTASSDSDDNAE